MGDGANEGLVLGRERGAEPVKQSRVLVGLSEDGLAQEELGALFGFSFGCLLLGRHGLELPVEEVAFGNE